jgi:hypothetical protein
MQLICGPETFIWLQVASNDKDVVHFPGFRPCKKAAKFFSALHL